MSLKDETLEQLFDRWNAFRKTNPTRSELNQFQDMEYSRFDRNNSETSYRMWHDKLPSYYQRKADLLLELYSRLDGKNHYQGIISQIRENIPQFSYFLLVRHIKLFILNDTLGIEEYKDSSVPRPKWLENFIQRGISIEELQELAQYAAHDAIWNLVKLTDGTMKYGDLPHNALSPVIFEYLDNGFVGHILDGVHEILNAPQSLTDDD